MKYLKFILSLFAGIATFSILFLITQYIITLFEPSDLLLVIYSLILTFFSTAVTVIITNHYKAIAAILVGVFVNFIAFAFLAILQLAVGANKNFIMFLPVLGGIVGWLSYKVTSHFINKKEKIKL